VGEPRPYKIFIVIPAYAGIYNFINFLGGSAPIFTKYTPAGSAETSILKFPS
jgi:hypothetical protein